MIVFIVIIGLLKSLSASGILAFMFSMPISGSTVLGYGKYRHVTINAIINKKIPTVLLKYSQFLNFVGWRTNFSFDKTQSCESINRQFGPFPLIIGLSNNSRALHSGWQLKQQRLAQTGSPVLRLAQAAYGLDSVKWRIVLLLNRLNRLRSHFRIVT